MSPVSSVTGIPRFRHLRNSAQFASSNIPRCLVAQPLVASDFPYEKAELVKMVTSAFDRWIKYVQARGLAWEAGTTKFAKTIEVLSQCAEEQLSPPNVDSEDLTFYFGVQSSRVASQIGKFNKPAAFAHREKYDVATGWGRGFVWFTSPRDYPLQYEDTAIRFDWSDPFELESVVMHEIGHVFGNRHVEGTVMREDLVNLLLSRRYIRMTRSDVSPAVETDYEILAGGSLEPLTQIDAHRQLVNSNGLHTATVSRDIFALLVGRDAVGPAKALVDLKGSGPVFDVVLELKDNAGTAALTLRILAGRSSLMRHNLVFNKLVAPEQQTIIASEEQRAGVIHAVIYRAGNIATPATLEHNLSPLGANVLTINVQGKLYQLVLRPK